MIWAVRLIFLVILVGSRLEANEKERHPKVALLFLTYGDLNHAHFWQAYLTPHLDKFNVYIHPKTRLKEPFFARYTVRQICETTWLNTIVAQKSLLSEAFKEKDNVKFVLLSNSCLPLVSAETLYLKLLEDDFSSFYWTPRGWWSHTDPREVVELPPEHRTGNYQQFVLNRRHAEICILDEFILNLVKKHPNDQESYPSCLLSVHGCLDEVKNFNFTFVDWNRKTPDGWHPYTFSTRNDYDMALLLSAKSAGHLFARKFAPEYPEEAIFEVIKPGP